jgi:hypothetical protein
VDNTNDNAIDESAILLPSDDPFINFQLLILNRHRTVVSCRILVIERKLDLHTFVGLISCELTETMRLYTELCSLMAENCTYKGQPSIGTFADIKLPNLLLETTCGMIKRAKVFGYNTADIKCSLSQLAVNLPVLRKRLYLPLPIAAIEKKFAPLKQELGRLFDEVNDGLLSDSYSFIRLYKALSVNANEILQEKMDKLLPTCKK